MADHVRRFVALALLAGLLVVAPHAAAPAAATVEVATEDSTFRVDDVRPSLGRVGDDLVAREDGVDAFTTIGVTSSADHGRVRAHLPGGWTPWFELHGYTGTTTDPVWVGDDADGWELRLPTGATDVVVHLVRPT